MRELTQPPTYFYAHDVAEEAYRDPTNFAAHSHLNTGGAEVYTRDIIQFMRTDNLVPDPHGER